MNTTKKQGKPAILFICTPSLGLLDNWLPALWELKQKKEDFEFTIVFPRTRSAGEIKFTDTIIQLGMEIFDKVIYRAPRGGWVICDGLRDAKESVDQLLNESRVEKLARKLNKRRPLKPLAGLIETFIRFYRMKTLKQARRLNLQQYMKRVKAVCFDIYTERKAYNQEILNAADSIPRFSIFHGVLVNKTEQQKAIRFMKEQDRNAPITAYLYAEDEVEPYKKNYKLSDSQLKVVGVPRHEGWWIDKVVDFKSEEDTFREFSPYIFVVSRPANEDYFSKERKRQAIRDIKKLAWDDLGCNLVIKLHPKEKVEGHYEKVLGEDTYGTKWVYATSHPYKIGKSSLLTIVYYSGVAIDMLVMDIPSVERFNLSGLNEELLDRVFERDGQGNPVTSHANYGYVWNAANYEELKSCVDRIMNDRDQVVNEFKIRYSQVFASPEGSIETIVQDIERAIGPESP